MHIFHIIHQILSQHNYTARLYQMFAVLKNFNGVFNIRDVPLYFAYPSYTVTPIQNLLSWLTHTDTIHVAVVPISGELTQVSAFFCWWSKQIFTNVQYAHQWKQLWIMSPSNCLLLSEKHLVQIDRMKWGEKKLLSLFVSLLASRHGLILCIKFECNCHLPRIFVTLLVVKQRMK